MAQHIALLRGINVGGRRPLPMSKLRELCTSLGWSNVATYIASGNVWFEATDPSPNALHHAILTEFGYDVPIVLRTAAQLRAALSASPYAAQAQEDPKSVHLIFLSAQPQNTKVAALSEQRSPGDQFEVVGAEVHVHFSNGSQHSKITVAWLEKQLGVRASGRNWRTVERLARGH